MFTNHCSKCSKEFETKNPKRIICPDCLYASGEARTAGSAHFGSGPAGPRGGGEGQRPYAPQGGGRPYPRPAQQGGYARPQGGGASGGYAPRPQQGHGAAAYQRPQAGGYAPRPYAPQGAPAGRGYQGGAPQRGNFAQRGRGQGGGGGFRPPFIPPQQLADIERVYKLALPLPNPDVHEVIGKQLNMDPKKVFAAINIIRQRMHLPKTEFPKRPLAVTPDQLSAVQALYEPYLENLPIGVHKIIAKQLRMEEWRVHVAIKLIRKSHNLPRWNEGRDDLPPYMREQIELAREAQLKAMPPTAAGEAKPTMPGMDMSEEEAPDEATAPAEEPPEGSKPKKVASPRSKKAAPAATVLTVPEVTLQEVTLNEVTLVNQRVNQNEA